MFFQGQAKMRHKHVGSTIMTEIVKHAIDSIHLNRNSKNQAAVDILHHSEGALTIHWEILPESTDIKAGGDPEARPKPVSGLFEHQDKQGNLSFSAPAKPGAYRLFVTISSENNKVANANIPFYVDES